MELTIDLESFVTRTPPPGLDIPYYNPKTYAPPEHPKVEKVKASDIGILDSITEYIYQLIYT